MADQTSVRSAGAADLRDGHHANGVGVVGSIADFWTDMTTLVELQTKLTELDLKDSSQRALVPLGMVVAGLAVALGCVPVALLGIAAILASGLGMSPGLAMLLTAAVAIILAGLLLFVSARLLVRSLEPFRRSREELVRNLAWVRSVLIYRGRSYPKR
jgi:type IV secretory pathway VirB3-like protein